jgi:hypothetical protein
MRALAATRGVGRLNSYAIVDCGRAPSRYCRDADAAARPSVDPDAGRHRRHSAVGAEISLFNHLRLGMARARGARCRGDRLTDSFRLDARTRHPQSRVMLTSQ